MTVPDPPTLTRSLMLSVSPEDGVYDAARCLLSGTSAPHATPEHQAETMLKRLIEEYNFTFVTDPLTTLSGFLVTDGEDRIISVAPDLHRGERVFLYFHMLGHVALGHVDSAGSTTIYEFRERKQLPLHVRFQESRADRWAVQYIETIIADPGVVDSGVMALLQHALLTHTKQNGGAAAAWLSQTSTALFEKDRRYRWLRTHLESLLRHHATDLICV